jgi:hypothetical protein
MNDKEILLDILAHFSGWVQWVMDGMTLDTLRWQPDKEANNIAVTMWHISRSFDLLKVRLMENRPVEEELWFTKGWASKTGYDPRGKGWILPVGELLQYFDEAIEALHSYLENKPTDALYENAPGWPADPQTAYVCIRNFLMDSLGHLGEIRAIKAMKERTELPRNEKSL